MKKEFIENNINIQYLDKPHIVNINKEELELIQGDSDFEYMWLSEFKVINGKNEKFRFYLQIEKQEDKDDEDENELFDCCLYLKSGPAYIVKLKIIWDFVCQQLQLQSINRSFEMERNDCDKIEIFSITTLDQIQCDMLTISINIKIIS